MTHHRTLRSFTLPVVLTSIAVALSLALLVGWVLFIAQAISLTEEVSPNVWFLILGVLSFAFIVSVLIIFSVFIAKEMGEVRRQYSFIDSVTHELRSPLASIRLCLETLDREGLTREKQSLLRQMMMSDVRRLASFIDDVLQASQVSYDKTVVSLREVSLADLLHRSVQVAAERRGVDRSLVQVRVNAELRLNTDPAALEVVIKNLVDNAIKYSEDEVQVTVLGEIRDGRAVIEVRDRGIGIPKKLQKRIFHRFYRVPLSVVRQRRGTGLGLFVVSALVKNLGGRVEAISDGPGQGTIIRIVLPQDRRRGS
ncbi:MAG: HAMP domain-containing sensor histidine kinase [Myxococcota bacterium]